LRVKNYGKNEKIPDCKGKKKGYGPGGESEGESIPDAWGSTALDLDGTTA